MKKYADRSIPAFNRLWYNYRRMASIRHLPFTITKVEFKLITLSPCFYCGEHPKYKIHDNKKGDLSSYTYNGLDRRDNNKGYTTENVVPCCAICNLAKSNLSYEKFIEWIGKITNNTHIIKNL